MENIIVVTVAVLLVIVGVIVGLNTHRCDECGKIYIGRKYMVFGSQVCEDCYEDTYLVLN